tara:strand:- start:4411 stop:5016 length:606 start_codon:yes stop_codon:yes gene_type:complete
MKNNNKLIPLNKDPLDLFVNWYNQAKKTEINDPNAMNLSTVSEKNRPSSRIVLLKSFNKDGFVFYTNIESKKGKSLQNNKYVALNFYWKSLHKQIRIEGSVFKISNKKADKYFNSRPLDSRIGAWASAQSKLLKNRDDLIKKFETFKKKFAKIQIYRPNYWTGYIVVPNLIEFWQEMPFRLHDRVEYKKIGNMWKSRNLYP